MQLIDETFFIGEINIPNVSKEAVRERLDIFIKKYQKRFLEFLLGPYVSKDFLTALNDGEPLEPHWAELVAKLVDSDTKESPIANYVYYFYMRDAASFTSDSGEVRQSTENSVAVSPARKMVRAWNEMCDFVHGTQEWFHDWYATWNYDYNWYFFRWYCYETYKGEFAYQNILNL